MAIEIRETFQVQAPIDAVWRFVMDPQQVVIAMPGATLEQIVDERTFLGAVRVKVGAISANYKGCVQITEIDPSAYRVCLVADGRETGGGAAKGTMASRLRELPGGATEVTAEATVDLTGRLMQVGRGMIQGVAHQLFQQFVAGVQQRLVEVPAATSGLAATPSLAAPAPVRAEAIRVLPLLSRVLLVAILRFFRRLFSPRATVQPPPS